jgi:hypothetical protein
MTGSFLCDAVPTTPPNGRPARSTVPKEWGTFTTALTLFGTTVYKYVKQK